jgi:hypothetical protein
VLVVTDALWLHYPVFFLADGTAVRPPASHPLSTVVPNAESRFSSSTQVEGISYSYLSIQDAALLSEMMLAAFGEAPAAIVSSLPVIERVVSYHLAAMSGDAKLVDFGDSHSKSGFAVATLKAASLSRIALNDASLPLKMTACQARRFNAAVYGSFVTVSHSNMLPSYYPVHSDLQISSEPVFATHPVRESTLSPGPSPQRSHLLALSS